MAGTWALWLLCAAACVRGLDLDALFDEGFGLIAANDWTACRALFRRVLGLSVNDHAAKDALNALGVCVMEDPTQPLADAQRHFEAALRIDPSMHAAKSNLAKCPPPSRRSRPQVCSSGAFMATPSASFSPIRLRRRRPSRMSLRSRRVCILQTP